MLEAAASVIELTLIIFASAIGMLPLLLRYLARFILLEVIICWGHAVESKDAKPPACKCVSCHVALIVRTCFLRRSQ